MVLHAFQAQNGIYSFQADAKGHGQDADVESLWIGHEALIHEVLRLLSDRRRRLE